MAVTLTQEGPFAKNYVKFMLGEHEHECDLDLDHQVQTKQRELYNAFRIPVARQKLMFEGKQLDPLKTFAEQGVKRLSVITVESIAPPAAPPVPATETTTHNAADDAAKDHMGAHLQSGREMRPFKLQDYAPLRNDIMMHDSMMMNHSINRPIKRGTQHMSMAGGMDDEAKEEDDETLDDAEAKKEQKRLNQMRGRYKRFRDGKSLPQVPKRREEVPPPEVAFDGIAISSDAVGDDWLKADNLYADVDESPFVAPIFVS